MTTLEGVPSPTEFFIAWLSARSKGRRNLPMAVTHSFRYRAKNALRSILHMGGFSLLTLAGFQWNIIAGLLVAGVSCFVFSALAMPASGEDETVTQTTHRDSFLDHYQR